MAEHEYQKGSDLPQPETASDGGTDAFALYRQRPIPVDRSVFWVLRGARVPAGWGDAYPPFITQAALRAMADHVVEATREAQKAAPLGFLVGELCRCSVTNVRYVVVDSVIPAPQLTEDDQTLNAIGRWWPRLQEMLRRDRRHLLGWYHVHLNGGLTPTAPDVAAHARHFPQPWQVAVVIRGGAGTPAAVVWRPEVDRPRDLHPIPFYEMVDPEELRAGGRITRYFDWEGYRAELPPDRKPVAPGGRVEPRSGQAPEPPGSARVILPKQLDEALAAEDEAQPLFRPPPRSPVDRFGVPRVAIVAAAVIIGLGALAVWRYGLAPRPAEQAPVTTQAPTTTTQGPTATAAATSGVGAGHARLDRLAGAAARAVTGYRERARLFDNKQMTCADLGRGLVGLENAWTAYNADGRARVGELDAAEAKRDTELAAEVQSAERHFVASGCPRP